MHNLVNKSLQFTFNERAAQVTIKICGLVEDNSLNLRDPIVPTRIRVRTVWLKLES